MNDIQPTEIELEVTCLADSMPAELSSVTPKELLDIYIPADRDFHSRLRLRQKSDKRVQKHRYNVVIGGYDAEVDVFQGALEGLVLIDFEFATLAEKAAFIPPACCLQDVTQEEFIAGGQLAGKSYDDISADLARFGYTRLSLN